MVFFCVFVFFQKPNRFGSFQLNYQSWIECDEMQLSFGNKDHYNAKNDISSFSFLQNAPIVPIRTILAIFMI